MMMTLARYLEHDIFLVMQADSNSHTLRYVVLSVPKSIESSSHTAQVSWKVTTLAGSLAGTASASNFGSADGQGTAASFEYPTGVASGQCGGVCGRGELDDGLVSMRRKRANDSSFAPNC